MRATAGGSLPADNCRLILLFRNRSSRRIGFI